METKDCTGDGTVEKALAGDSRAFSRLVKIHYAAVRATAYSVLLDRAASEDVAQDAFVIAWKSLADLQDPRRFSAWVRGIARNQARMHRRRLKREHVGSTEERAGEEWPQGVLEEKEQREGLVRALSALDEDEREAVVLSYGLEQSAPEVGALLEVEPATVRQRLSRARSRLKFELKPLLSAEGRYFAPSAATIAAIVAVMSTVQDAAAASSLSAAATDASSSASKGGALMLVLGSVAAAVAALLAVEVGRPSSEVVASSDTEARAAHSEVARLASMEPGSSAAKQLGRLPSNADDPLFPTYDFEKHQRLVVRVVDESGLPIAGAVLRYLGEIVGETNGFGDAELESLRSSVQAHKLLITAEGFADGAVLVGNIGLRSVTLGPPAQVLGQVISEDGQALSGVEVVTHSVGEKQSATTDEHGRFVFDSLVPDKVYVFRTKRSPLVDDSVAEVRTDTFETKSVTLQVGSMPEEDSYQLRGRLLGAVEPAVAPSLRIRAVAAEKDGYRPSGFMSVVDNQYRISVSTPGLYEIHLVGFAERAEDLIVGTIQISKRREERNLSLQLPEVERTTLDVFVLGREGPANVGNYVDVRTETNAGDMQLLQCRVATDGSCRIVLNHIGPLRNDMWVTANAGNTQARVRANAGRVTLRVPPLGAVRGMAIPVRLARNPYITVIARRVGIGGAKYYTYTDDEGRFLLNSLPAGDYELSIHDGAGTTLGRKEVEVRGGELARLSFQDETH